MYAVIQTGGKQYRVAKGDQLRVEKLMADTQTTIELDQVLMVAAGKDVRLGTPYVEGGKVTALVKAHGRADKVKIIKFKRRKHYMKRQGHRQYYTLVEITDITAAGLAPESAMTAVSTDLASSNDEAPAASTVMMSTADHDDATATTPVQVVSASTDAVDANTTEPQTVISGNTEVQDGT